MRSNNMVARSATLVLTALAAAACGGKDTQQAAGIPAREIQLAPATPAQPQLNDAPEKTASAPKKAPAAPKEAQKPAPLHVQVSPIAPPPATAVAAAPAAGAATAAPTATLLGTIDAGTSFVVNTAVRICTNTHKVGDRFSTSLAESVQGSNGAIIPAGSPVVLRIVESAKSQNTKDSVRLVFDAVSVKVGDASYPVDGRIAQTAKLEKVRVQSTAEQAEKIGAGAAIGAIVGQVLGKNTKSTVIGGAVGAAAGAAVAAGTADYDGCVPQNTPITITLQQPLMIRVGPARTSPY